MIHHHPVFAAAVIAVLQADCVRTSILRHFRIVPSSSFSPFCRQVNIPLDTDQQSVYTQYSARSETLTAIPIEVGGPAHRLPGPTREMETDNKDAWSLTQRPLGQASCNPDVSSPS